MKQKPEIFSSIALTWISLIIFLSGVGFVSCSRKSFSEKMEIMDDSGRQSLIQMNFPPDDYSAYSEKLTVSGKANDNGGIEKIEVLVNGQVFQAGAGLSWSIEISLSIGENKIVAKMTNSKGSVVKSNPAYVYRLWKKSAEMPGPSAYQSVVSDGTYIYLLGGWTFYWDFLPAVDYFWRYDPLNSVFNTYMPLLRPHYSSGAFFYNNQIILMGGLKKKSFGNDWKDQALNKYINFFTTGGYSAASEKEITVPNYVVGGSASGLINGKAYLAGGVDADGGAVDSILEYNLNTASWANKKALNKKLKFACSVVYNNRLYIFGGSDENNQFQKTIYAYDPVADDWTLYPDKLGIARSGMGCVLIGNKAYLIGGENQAGFLDTVEAFDFLKEQSGELRKMPEKIAYMAAATDGVKIFLFGGKTGEEFPSMNRVYEYYPLLDNLNQ